MWDRIGEDVDLLIIGGGINGAGIARDAARRGLKVALVEMRDLAWGTSSRSSKLVHGGLRYLEHMEFSLVFEAVSERRILLDIAPHLVNPLGFLFPVFSTSRQSLMTLRAGMWLYDGLSLFRSPKMHRTLGPKDVAREEPLLRREGLKGAPLYYDCATDDARLTLENALDAAELGAIIATWTRCTGFEHDEGGRVVGARVEDAFTGETRTLRARAIINATGPWTDAVLGLGNPLDRELLRPTKGVHIVVPRERLPVRHAVVCFHPDDGRVLFAIPWQDHTYLGTTDTDYRDDPGAVAADADDVRYLIEASNAYFPEQKLAPEDVVSTWAGLRPLMRPVGKGASVDESAVSREHQVIVGQDGLITIAGGKLTTYRKMSQEVVDTAVKMLRLGRHLDGPLSPPHTDREPLPGAVGWPRDDDHDQVAARVHEAAGEAISARTARLLTDTYGMRALEVVRLLEEDPELATPIEQGRPEIDAQVVWAVRRELAATVADVMVRRTQLYYRSPDQGLAAAEGVSRRMAAELGWSEAERRASVEGYRERVGRSRAWRSPSG